MIALIISGREDAGRRNAAPHSVFVMAGGGTGGHVIPSLAVASLLRARGHKPHFIGTKRGIEAKLVPQRDFPIEWIEIGGLKGKGLSGMLSLLFRLPLSVLRCCKLLGQWRPAAVFSMGGYVAGPVMLAALLRGVPMVAMEPNAMPGFTSRMMGRFLYRVLASFRETLQYFPPGKGEITGLPVRQEFFECPLKRREGEFVVLITGGSQGSRRLNLAAREAWEKLRAMEMPVRLIHQAGPAMAEELREGFARTGLKGEVVAFIEDMPAAFAQADLVVGRSGAGAVSELAAAGKPSLLVPFPQAADNHQLRNAEAMQRAGAARLIPDGDWNGERMAAEIRNLIQHPNELERMAHAARGMSHPGAAEQAVEILERLAGGMKSPQ